MGMTIEQGRTRGEKAKTISDLSAGTVFRFAFCLEPLIVSGDGGCNGYTSLETGAKGSPSQRRDDEVVVLKAHLTVEDA